MTFFKNRSVFFFSFDFLKGTINYRTKKQIGKITKAIDSLNVINEDISAKNMRSAKKVQAIETAMDERSEIQEENRTVLYHLKRAL